MPIRTFAGRSEISVPGRKTSKDRVTIMLCANATGSHKLPILMIGKFKRPRCFKNMNAANLGVVYKSQKSGWMDSALFEDWFITNFITEVKKKRKDIGVNSKVILLVDNAPSHKVTEVAKSQGVDFIVKFLTPNITAILQPMG